MIKAKRLIVRPGFHVKSKYDMRGFREHVNKGQERDFDVVLPLTPMIDMFSMLVIFLILNFSATGEAFFVNKNIKIPEAYNARPLESLPLITITKEYVAIDTETTKTDPVNQSMNLNNMAALEASIRRLKYLQDNLISAGLKTKTQVNIQADRDVPVLYIKRVMNLLISQGFTGINFAVKEKNEQ